MTNWLFVCRLHPSSTSTSTQTLVNFHSAKISDTHFCHPHSSPFNVDMGASASKICPCHQRDAVTIKTGKNVIPWRHKNGGGTTVRAPRIGVISRQSGIDLDKSIGSKEGRGRAISKPKFFNHQHNPTHHLNNHHRNRFDQPAGGARAPNDARNDDDYHADDASHGLVEITGANDDDEKDDSEKNMKSKTIRTTPTTTTQMTRQIVIANDEKRKNDTSAPATTLSKEHSGNEGIVISNQHKNNHDQKTTANATITDERQNGLELLSSERLSTQSRIFNERKQSWAQSDSGRCSVEGDQIGNSSNGVIDDHLNNNASQSVSTPVRVNAPIAAWSTQKKETDRADVIR